MGHFLEAYQPVLTMLGAYFGCLHRPASSSLVIRLLHRSTTTLCCLLQLPHRVLSPVVYSLRVIQHSQATLVRRGLAAGSRLLIEQRLTICHVVEAAQEERCASAGEPNATSVVDFDVQTVIMHLTHACKRLASAQLHGWCLQNCSLRQLRHGMHGEAKVYLGRSDQLCLNKLCLNSTGSLAAAVLYILLRLLHVCSVLSL